MIAGRWRRFISALIVLFGLSACAAATTVIDKRALDVQTRMTDTVFLDPVAADRRTVFVQIRNTSDRPDFEIEPQVVARLADSGWRVVRDPERARYLLQANVLQVGRSSRSAAERTFAQGFGGTLIGAAAGAGAGRVVSEAPGAMVGGELAGAATAAAADALVQDVAYSVITDVQVSERSAAGVIVTERLNQEMGQGSSGTRVLSATETTEWKRYRTRILSTANQANLDFEDAAPALAEGLTRAIAGIF